MVSCWSTLLPSRRSAPEQAPLLNEKAACNVEKPHCMRTTSTTLRLQQLRGEMCKEEIDYYVVPTGDAHGSEYVGECDKRRSWISGFTGSAGVAIIGREEQALVFADSRYWVQASKQLDSNWSLRKVGSEGVADWDEHLTKLPASSRVGIDPSTITYAAAKALLAKLHVSRVELVFPSENLVDRIWTARPTREHNEIKEHPLKFTGKPASEKLSDLRAYLSKAKDGNPESTPSFLVSSLTNIAWILNLRGSDILFNPFFYSYLLVGPSSFTLYAQAAASTDKLKAYITDLGGNVSSYEQVWEDVKDIKILGSSSTSWALVKAIGEDNFTAVPSPIDAAQVIKNKTELQGFRNAYLRDGAAWARWAGWLEERIQAGAKISEWDAAEELTNYRKQGEHYAGLAYDNISATGENAALPHYAPSPTGSSVIDINKPYLNDSGPQYLDGTIDTTRTMHFGKPTKAQKRAFTRVLQGHIAIDSLVFPEGTTGMHIDALARSALWKDGMNLCVNLGLHGTGHGIGSYLAVHELPPSIGGTLGSNMVFVPGHTLSNEPGFYEEGNFGIRLESIISVKPVTTRRAFGDKQWLGFERFTTVSLLLDASALHSRADVELPKCSGYFEQIPIQSSFVDLSLMSPSEKKWLKEHNALCVEKLTPLLQDDKRAKRWLKRQ